MSNTALRKRRRRLNYRFWAVMAVIALALIALIVSLLVKGEEAITDDTRATGNISAAHDYEAVIIRNEEAVITDSFDRADYMVYEGQQVTSDTHIMDVYKRGFSDELLLSLYQTDIDIYNAQLEQLGETRDETLTGYNEAAEIVKAKIASAAMAGETEKLLPLQTELKNVLTERSGYLKSFLQQTETLKALYRTQQEQSALISTWKNTLYSKKAGTVSFYFDDYENALNEEKLSMLTSGLINSAAKGRAAAEWTTQNENLAYRLVDTGHWYVAYLTDASEPLRTVSGARYLINIKGYGEYEAEALEPVMSGKKAVNILRVNEDIGDLINVRRVDISVQYNAGGIRIRLDGIIVDGEGKRYVELMFSKERRRTEIDVYAVDKKYAVIAAKPDEENKISAGVRYWIP